MCLVLTLPVLCADYAISKPDILARIERGEEPCAQGPLGPEEGSEEDAAGPQHEACLPSPPEPAPSPIDPTQEPPAGGPTQEHSNTSAPTPRPNMGE